MRFMRNGFVRALVASGIAALARVKMVLSVGTLYNRDSFSGALNDKSFGSCLVGFHFWHIFSVAYSVAEEGFRVK